MKRQRKDKPRELGQDFYKKPQKREDNPSVEEGAVVFGIHPITHLLKDTKDVDFQVKSLWIQEGIESPEIKQILRMAQNKSIPVVSKTKLVLDKVSYNQNHQGVLTFVKEENFYKPIEALANSKFVLILDHLEDPHNLGAILRTADQFGVQGVVLTKNRSVGVTSSVFKVSSGAALFVPIIQASSLLFVVEKLKEYGFWVYSTCVEKGEPLDQVDFSGKVAIIVGNESKGVSEQLLKKSDFILSIPTSPKKKVDSLNVSVATGILLYEASKKIFK